jgi:hypothetical protein
MNAMTLKEDMLHSVFKDRSKPNFHNMQNITLCCSLFSDFLYLNKNLLFLHVFFRAFYTLMNNNVTQTNAQYLLNMMY